MSEAAHRVAIVGCGRQGQAYADAYTAYPDTQVVAIVEPNAERRRVVAKRCEVPAHFGDVASMLAEVVPDVVSIVTPVQYTKDAVIACAEAGVKGISTEKPIGGVLSDADAMIDACAKHGVVFSGGCLQSAMPEVQEVAARIRRGDYGTMTGAAVHGFAGEIVGGGCQHISILRLLMNVEIESVTTWGSPVEALRDDVDGQLSIHGTWRLTDGVQCAVFGRLTGANGVDVWNEDAMVRWPWGPPEIFVGHDATGARTAVDPNFAPYEHREFTYMTGSVRSLLRAIETGSRPWITAEDLRRALEVAIASRQSALLGHAEVRLPLQDRSLRFFPSPYRWSGGDATGNPQSIEDAETPRRRW